MQHLCDELSPSHIPYPPTSVIDFVNVFKSLDLTAIHSFVSSGSERILAHFLYQCASTIFMAHSHRNNVGFVVSPHSGCHILSPHYYRGQESKERCFSEWCHSSIWLHINYLPFD